MLFMHNKKKDSAYDPDPDAHTSTNDTACFSTSYHILLHRGKLEKEVNSML